MNRIPEVRALCVRARRPLARLIVGGLLVIPAAALGARPHLESWPVEQDHQDVEIERAVETARTAVQEAWRAKTIERERQHVSLEFADRFRIPLNLAHEIHLAALREDVPVELAFKLVRAESKFRARAVSPVGAVGLTQLMPSTASWLAPGTLRGQLFDPRINLRVGFRYLRMLLDEYENEHLALTAYNRGPGTVNRLLRRGVDPDNGYTDYVIRGDASKHVAWTRRVAEQVARAES